MNIVTLELFYERLEMYISTLDNNSKLNSIDIIMYSYTVKLEMFAND